jgi:hypothetical protein
MEPANPMQPASQQDSRMLQITLAPAPVAYKKIGE